MDCNAYIFLRCRDKWNLHDTGIQMEVRNADYKLIDHKSFRELDIFSIVDTNLSTPKFDSTLENMSRSLNNT
jgi:hypothetical protein